MLLKLCLISQQITASVVALAIGIRPPLFVGDCRSLGYSLLDVVHNKDLLVPTFCLYSG